MSTQRLASSPKLSVVQANDGPGKGWSMLSFRELASLWVQSLGTQVHHSGLRPDKKEASGPGASSSDEP